MKKFKLMFVLAMLLILAACEDYGEKRIVKLVTVDRENISFYYYDFTQDKPTYLVEQKQNTGIENTMTQLMSENEYDLKLCSLVVCEKSVIEENMSELFTSLLNSRFSPDVSIIEGGTKEQSEKYIEAPKTDYPIHSYYFENGSLNGIVENTDNSEKHIIYKNKVYTTLDRQQSLAVDIVSKTASEGKYTFENDGKIVSAHLENISTYYSVNDERVVIKISAILKDYKGMPANKAGKEEVIKLVQTNLDKDITEIYSDSILSESLNLYWFKQISDADIIKTDIVIK